LISATVEAGTPTNCAGPSRATKKLWPLSRADYP
jgi:hypothetical protein